VELPSEVAAAISDALGAGIVEAVPVSGGDVAASYRVELSDARTVFAKTHADPPRHFFDTEARGLQWLRDANALPVPEVLAVSTEPPLLVLTWIDERRRTPADSGAFGRGLAALHQAGAPTFGREDHRTTGSRGLPNEPSDSWVDFFGEQRILVLAKLAVDGGTYDLQTARWFERIAARLDVLGGEPESPARLHGDLWSGNRIVDTTGESWLIDPACHGGHREFDLAMMRLFGGFSEDEFAAYNEAFPLATGWRDRVELHQLAPLMVHAIKFGGGYVNAALAAAQRYA